MWREIVGVVGDVRQDNVEASPASTIYRPYTQIVEHDMYLMVRADARAALPGVMASLRSRLPSPAEDCVDRAAAHTRRHQRLRIPALGAASC